MVALLSFSVPEMVDLNLKRTKPTRDNVIGLLLYKVLQAFCDFKHCTRTYMNWCIKLNTLLSVLKLINPSNLTLS